MSLWSSPNQHEILCESPGTKLLILLVLVAGSTAIATMEPIKKSTDYQFGTTTGAEAVSRQDTSEANMHASPSPVITDEIKIVDSQGHPRIIMSAKSGNPVIRLLRANGVPSVEVLLDSTGHPAVQLANPDLTGPTAALAVDDKGTHVKFDRPGGASSYLFLNNAGESGVVFVDANGVRRLNVLVGPDNDAKIERFGSDGKPIPQLKP